jgi:lipopolysaccharide transport system ATP-binding protein
VSADLLVELAGVGKRYPRVARPRDRLRALGQLLLRRELADPVSVLEDVNFQVRRGESIGIIGENGAGKSTLLKVLTGVLGPSTGTVKLQGSYAALLELGAGFHPEYSGRENLEMAGALMGFAPGELKRKLPEILAFADIGRYIDEPIKHYSSGMIVRLGFALVAARRPDLLITDEVLAVGDEAFQRKCVSWLEQFLAQGGTLMLVSHSMYHVQKLCRHALWLHQGRVMAYGDVYDVSQQYLAFEERRIAQQSGRTVATTAQGLEFAVVGVALNGVDSETPKTLEPGAGMEVGIRIASRDGRIPQLALGITRIDGTPVYGTSSEIAKARPQRSDANHFEYRLRFAALPLLPGGYLVRAHAMDPEALRLFDTVERPFIVRGATREFGLVRLEHEWLAPVAEPVAALEPEA